ncbi:hypothetical protein [Thermoflexus hugenholtzii]|jgi:hypothetical protein|uniref:Uncharacterized protein n=1 Tax=Thermoflexus hugenholtzii JAD2 TaxID=877466 RepID=A0A212RT01_9CHLR|nr:hypothetical protein [Thermoflexus hugenholtzii]SNB75797.1 hypothetical protein SAMN02746019_00020410 [Thermoflexus hugenholtzii JAD2]
MRKAILAGLLCVFASCAPRPLVPPSNGTIIPTPAFWESITPIGEILADPSGYQGREVTILAYYRGWDLLGEAGVGPPLTRSDVAVADPTGCIYIAPAGEEAMKDIPLRPFDREATETLLRLHGQVRRSPRGQPYILVTKGEVWNGLPARVLLRVRRTGGIAGMDHELMAMADGTLYFLDRKNRLHVRWKTTPDAVARTVEGLRPFLDQEVGTPVPDGFAYAVTVQEGEQIRKVIFHEGTLPGAADPALAPLREWLREAMERAPYPPPTPTAHPDAVRAAIRFLAMQLDLSPEAIRVIAWEPVDWPDAALGCPEPGKVYAQIITPGYVVFLEARGETFRVHTDRTGERACRP